MREYISANVNVIQTHLRKRIKTLSKLNRSSISEEFKEWNGKMLVASLRGISLSIIDGLEDANPNEEMIFTSILPQELENILIILRNTGK